ncbi:MAG TPA: DNRLRE domain-containing protein, partial [Chitinophagaceae bacterium]|nr:DNRLRE domain-containing protein [Chitinophagaceae bacterium]
VQSVCITASEDALIHEFVPTTNYGGFANMRASRHTYGGTWATTKTLYKFDMSSLPAGALITGATMTLSTCYDCTPYYLHYDLGGGTGNKAIVKQVTSPWTEYGVTWNTAPNTTSVGAFITADFGNGTSTSLVQTGMASLAQSWFNNPSLNYGVELSVLDNSDYYHGLFFGSRETSYPQYRPKICIDYIMPSSCNQILCNGGTMNIQVGATGGVPGYTGTGVFTTGAGPFSYTVTDANGCTSTVSGVLYEPAPIETIIKLDTCDNYFWPANGYIYTSSGIYSHVFTAANGCDSTVTLDLTLHTPPPTTFVGITSCGPYYYPANGIYYLASTQFSYLGGKDSYGCDSVFVVNITINPQPTIQVIPFDANCITGLGAFALMPSGGTAPYTITVTPCPSVCSYVGLGISTSQIYPIGNYTITVIDANGCSASTTSSIVASPPLSINLITHQPLCGNGNGAFSFSGPNPMDTYTFAISPCPLGAPCTYVTNGISTSYAYPPGTYTITMTDVNGCSTSTSTTITAGPPLSMNLIVHPPLCGTGLGAFSFSGPNASQNYTFSISPCPLGAPCSYVTSGLSTSYWYPVGTYTITITDANGCTGTSLATITNPSLCSNTNSLIINTGYDPVTNLVLSGSGIADPQWLITAVGGAVFSPAITTSFNPAGSLVCRAISNSVNENSYGQRIYRREFKMCGDENIVFDLNLAYDNWINGIYVDGVLVTVPSTITPSIDYNNPANFSFFHNYNFTKYLTAGTHTLDVYLFNEGGPTILKINGTLTGVSNSLVTNTSPANCCCNAQVLTSTGTIKIFNQGYYIGNGEMQPVLSNQGVGTSVFATDSMVIELHEAMAPYALVSSFKQIVTNNGNCDFSFPSSMEGTAYYIVVKHRNSLETWSAQPVLLSNQINYDFTQASTQAYGANQQEVETGVWAIYSGDINQDGFIDSFDFPLLDTDIFNGVSGVYVSTDLNGDGFVDSFDFPIFDANSYNGVSVMTP